MVPSLTYEKTLWESGCENIVGIDEVGRGAWAGPLTLAAVVIPSDSRIYKVRDSKQLSSKKRENVFERLIKWCRWSLGHASHQECDQLGMSQAQRLAASRALKGLSCRVDAILADGKWNFLDHDNVTMIVKGDSKSLSIASASVIAKVSRDKIMTDYSPLYPGYRFESNKGYPSAEHRQYLYNNGPSPIHRTSWSFMNDIK